MEKLIVTAHMKTPFITGGGYMTLDALLAGILFDQLQDVEAAHSSIPIKCTNGLFHASAAIYETLTHTRAAFVANLRAEHSLDPDLFPKKRDGTIHRKIGRTKQEQFGAVLNSYDCKFVESIEWHAEGDSEKIMRVIESNFFLGKRRASGFGEVTHWTIESSELDGLTGYVDEPLRPIPVNRFTGDKASLKVDAAWRPAYWDPANRTTCYAPEPCE
ncbi:MAG: hypothetical protein ISP76_05195 [Burkholderiales bacterium]|nr:hypothetical protein [Burkholderiales bacterium]